MKMTAEDIAKRRKRDAEIDANSKLEIKLLCHKCRYRMFDASNERVNGCDFVSHTGHLRDRGNGPGDCRSFEPIKPETKKERVARYQRSLMRSEANRKV